MIGYQVPRNSLAWLLAAQVAVIAPHVMRLPVWVTLVCIGCVLWRVMVYQGRWAYPGRWVKTAFVAAGLVGIGIGYGGKVTGVEPAVALLMIAYVFKLLEMHRKRDAYIVILMGYFVAITEFLFSQTILMSLYMFATVTLITAALIGLNQTLTHHEPVETLRLAATMLAQSLPLMLVLFVLFPRISPLWTVPLESQAAKSGVSDRMRPGDIASLSLSPELAFKATFEGQAPPKSELYWRGLVFEEYDGRTWSRHRGPRGGYWRDVNRAPAWTGTIQRQGEPVRYSIIQEPTRQNWLFSLAVPMLPVEEDVVMLADYTLAYYKASGVTSKLKYSVSSHANHRLASELDPAVRERNTLLPLSENVRSLELAAQLRSASVDEADYVQRVLQRFATQNYAYTLQPPTLGRNDIDEFLFDTQRGFCEHYAGAFTFLMRAAGVPARVVVGYQGGEYNRAGDYYSVYQFDAHAWSEVWLAGQGWVRVDPTSMVAPERIEQGLETAVEGEDTFLAESPLSWLKYSQVVWMTDLRQQLQAIGHYWDNWVVGYTPETQLKVFSKYFQDIDRSQIGMIMLGAFFTLLAVIALVVMSRRSHRLISQVDGLYLECCQTLNRRRLGRRNGEGPVDYARRVSQAKPELAAPMQKLTQLYIALNYGEQDAKDAGRQLQEFKRAARLLRLRTLAVNT